MCRVLLRRLRPVPFGLLLLLMACGGGDRTRAHVVDSVRNDAEAADVVDRAGDAVRDAGLGDTMLGPADADGVGGFSDAPDDALAAEDSGHGLDADGGPCRPDCGERVCGPDYCGGRCGDCAPGETCVAGACVCSPVCANSDGMTCGDDGCGARCSCDTKAAGVPMYCDEATLRCVPAAADCEGGWCRIPAGSSPMGAIHDVLSPSNCRELSLPVHRVVLTRPYAIQATEVTVAAYAEILGPQAVPHHFAGCGQDCPMVETTVFAALRYANLLSDRDGLERCYALDGCTERDYWCEPGDPNDCWDVPQGIGLECGRAEFAGPDCLGYRLPSEAEWEFAARAGTLTCLPSGRTGSPGPSWPQWCDASDAQDEVAWYCGDSAASYEGCGPGVLGCSPLFAEPGCGGVHPVARKLPNAFGLFDTSGNVGEFTGSLLRTYTAETQVDPGFDRVLRHIDVDSGPWDLVPAVRGGWWTEGCEAICSSFRWPQYLHYAGTFTGLVGFRLARTLPTPNAPLVVGRGSGLSGPR